MSCYWSYYHTTFKMRGAKNMKKNSKINKCEKYCNHCAYGTFFILALKQIIDSNAVITIYTTVIAFYFGTQFEKKGTETNEDNTELPNK